MTVRALIDAARAAGVYLRPRLWCEGLDRLSDALRAELKAHEAEILRLLADGLDIGAAANDAGARAFDRSESRRQAQDEAARLETLRAEVQTARQVLRAELASVQPILADIFREWPGAIIAGLQYGGPAAEPNAPPSEPPLPEAIETRARELLAEAERILGVCIADPVKALDYYRARARAELPQTRRERSAS
jgi:hypothetical protein